MNTFLSATRSLPGWGIQPNGEHQFAKDYSCPHCGAFSYFCHGDFSKHAATDWRKSVVGFRFRHRGEVVGTAVLSCQACKQVFTLHIRFSAIDAYIADSALWPKPQAPSS